MMLLFALTLASTDKDPCHDHKSDGDNETMVMIKMIISYRYFMTITMSITTTMTDHDLVHDHDDHDDLDQVLHALLRALHQEGERKAEEEISKHARGGIDIKN